MSIILRLLARTLHHRWRLVGALGCMSGATASYLVLPALFGNAVDKIVLSLEGGTVSEAVMLTSAAAILAVGALRGLFAFGQTHLGESLSQAVVYDLRNSFYDHVQHLSFGFHDRHHTGNLMSRAITDVESLRMFINVGVVRIPYFLFLFVFVGIILLRLDWRLGLMSIGLMFPMGVIVGIVRIHLRRIWLHIQEVFAELSTVLQENLSGVHVVKAFAAEEFEEAKFDAGSTEVSAGLVNAARIQALNASLMSLVYLIGIGLILWYGGSRVMDKQMTWGELAQFIFYMQILSLPVRHAGMMVSAIARAMSSGQRLFEILDMESPVREAAGAVEMHRVKGHVRFEHVDFSYNKGTPVLEDINIEVEPGKVVALQGPPGSGKSTIVHLLPRFYDVDSGRITIDGMDLRDATLPSLRRNIAIVQQDVFLFASSIRDNIAYGRGEATMEEVVAAASVAQLHNEIESMEHGYETVIGERGTTLSGGQRQRLSIARAVLLDPPLLILDDSTSSVDAGTEELIRKAMEAVMIGRTTLVIAHRLSTVHRADQILVLNHGRIVERGTHTELLARNGLYHRIYELQLRPQEEVMLDIEVPATGRTEAAR